jgi:hypothetical protein
MEISLFFAMTNLSNTDFIMNTSEEENERRKKPKTKKQRNKQK